MGLILLMLGGFNLGTIISESIVLLNGGKFNRYDFFITMPLFIILLIYKLIKKNE
jgi:hypothetical protein